MNEKQEINWTVVDKAFKTGTVHDASDREMEEYLRVLNSQGIGNPGIQHLAINRALTINTILNLRYFKSVEKTNRIVTGAVIVLAVVEVAATVLSVALCR